MQHADFIQPRASLHENALQRHYRALANRFGTDAVDEALRIEHAAMVAAKGGHPPDDILHLLSQQPKEVVAELFRLLVAEELLLQYREQSE